MNRPEKVSEFPMTEPERDPSLEPASASMPTLATRESGAESVRVLYGGSVKADNVTSYVELADCDGCLVGGASLNAEEFSAMIEAVAEAGE